MLTAGKRRQDMLKIKHSRGAVSSSSGQIWVGAWNKLKTNCYDCLKSVRNNKSSFKNLLSAYLGSGSVLTQCPWWCHHHRLHNSPQSVTSDWHDGSSGHVVEFHGERMMKGTEFMVWARKSCFVVFLIKNLGDERTRREGRDSMCSPGLHSDQM